MNSCHPPDLSFLILHLNLSLTDTAGQKAARDLIGEVEGKMLLQEVAMDYMSSTNRRLEVQQFCTDDAQRLQRLAGMFTEEALVALRKQRAHSIYGKVVGYDYPRSP